MDDKLKQWHDMIGGMNRILMERQGCNFFMIIARPEVGSDLITNMQDPVQQLGYLRGATICAEEYFNQLRQLVITENAEDHLNATAQQQGKPPGGGSVN